MNLAAESGEFEVVKYLNEHGAEVNMKNNVGYTPLHAAVEFAWTCQNDKIDTVKCLIENGAKFDILSLGNETPFELANRFEMYEIATYLLRKKREASNKSPVENIMSNAPCIICFEPRNGFYVLNPCGHAALCEPCTYKIVTGNDSKCPNCREPIQNYTKMFFQQPESQ